MKIIDFRVNNTLYCVTREKVAEMEGETAEYAANHNLKHNYLDLDYIFNGFPGAVFGIWLSDVECSLCWTAWPDEYRDEYRVVDLTKGQRSE